MNLAVTASSTDEDNFSTMKEAYNACLNETAIKEVGVQPLMDLIQQVANSFRVSNATSEANDALKEDDLAHLSNTILLLEQWGVSTFEYLGTGADDKNPVSSTKKRRKNISDYNLGSCHNPSLSSRHYASFPGILPRQRYRSEIPDFTGDSV